MTRAPKHDRFRPTTLRTRLLILLLAIATAGVVLYAVLDPQARMERAKRPPPDRPLCEPGQTEDCVGGKVNVTVVPAAAPASPPR